MTRVRLFATFLIALIIFSSNVLSTQNKHENSPVHSIQLNKKDLPEAYDLFEISLPLQSIVDKGDEVLICVRGQYKGETLGFNLRLKKNLIPFLKMSDDEIESTNQDKWLENGCILESIGSETSFLIAEILKLTHLELPSNMEIKRKIMFKTALLLGNIHNINTFENIENSKKDVSIFPISFPDLGEDRKIARSGNSLKFKVEFVHSSQPPIRTQLIVVLDFENKKLIIQEKDNEMRNGLINTFYQTK